MWVRDTTSLTGDHGKLFWWLYMNIDEESCLVTRTYLGEPRTCLCISEVGWGNEGLTLTNEHNNSAPKCKIKHCHHNGTFWSYFLGNVSLLYAPIMLQPCIVTTKNKEHIHCLKLRSYLLTTNCKLRTHR